SSGGGEDADPTEGGDRAGNSLQGNTEPGGHEEGGEGRVQGQAEVEKEPCQPVPAEILVLPGVVKVLGQDKSKAEGGIKDEVFARRFTGKQDKEQAEDDAGDAGDEEEQQVADH